MVEGALVCALDHLFKDFFYVTIYRTKIGFLLIEVFRKLK